MAGRAGGGTAREAAIGIALTIEWTNRAQADVGGLYDFISADSQDAARGVVGAIRQEVDGLPIYPQMGRPGRLTRCQELVVEQYIVVYSVRRERILIIRVWQGAQSRQ